MVGLVEKLQPDVLLLDMEMPGKSGVAVAQELKESGADVRVLVLSAYDDDEYIASLLATGAAGYLTKEEALNTIVDAVRGVAGRMAGIAGEPWHRLRRWPVRSRAVLA